MHLLDMSTGLMFLAQLLDTIKIECNLEQAAQGILL